MNVSKNNHHIFLLLPTENISFGDPSLKENFKCLPSQQYFDVPALRKDIRVKPAIS